MLQFMFRRLARLLCVCFLIFLAVSTLVDSAEMKYSPNPFETALELVGLPTSVLGIDRADRGLYGGDKYRLHYFDVYSDDPLKIPVYIPQLRDRLSSMELSTYRLAAEGCTLIGKNIRVILIGEPLEKYISKCEQDNSLYNALVFANANFILPNSVEYTQGVNQISREDCEKVHPDVQYAIALMIYGTYLAQEYRNAAFEDFSGDELECLFSESVKYVAEEVADPKPYSKEEVNVDPESLEPIIDRTAKFVEDSIDRVDFGYLYTGYMHLAHAVDLAFNRVNSAELPLIPSPIKFLTPLGYIVIGSSNSDSHSYEETFLRIDVGGNDIYKSGGATRNSYNWVSVQIDMDGDDLYLSDNHGVSAQGSGVLGYGICIDSTGNDSYEGRALAQGAGVFGCGALLDLAGDDCYFVERAGQGSGWFGVGVLADFKGDDKYDCFQNSQGFGYTLGSGILLDSKGDDVYAANDSDIRYPSAQTKEHNGSLSQGFGFGKRADIIDGHSMAGGVGVLVDGEGDDVYICGVFGQGCAYWYGVGILADKSGDDKYTGQWYVQGSGAHFAIGILNDGCGNDTYKAPMLMAQGAGHDFSVGFLFEEDGNDLYESKSLCIGAGNANGVGIFWDKLGDDVYSNCESVCLGMPQSTATGGFRDFIRTTGIFIDTNGTDKYPSKFIFAANNSNWTWLPEKNSYYNIFDVGLGIDTEYLVNINS